MDIAALTLALVMSVFYRTFVAVLAPFLTRDLGIPASELSSVVGAWFLCFALAQFPVGVLLDRMGPRKAVAGFLGVGAGGGALVFALAQEAWHLWVGMAMIGAGCAPVMMSAMFLFARRYDPVKFATMTSLTMGIGGLGNILGAAPLAWAAEAAGWREVMMALAALGFALAGALLVLVKDPPSLEAPGRGQGLWRALGFDGYAELMRKPLLLAILPVALFNYAASGGMRGLWAGAYLHDVHGLSPSEVGVAVLFMAVVMTVGIFLFGPADRVLNTRKWLILGANGTGCLCMWVLALADPGREGAIGLIMAIGFCGATYALMVAHYRSFVPARLTGRGVTLINVFGMAGVALGQFVTAALADPLLAAGEVQAGYDRVFLWYAATLGMALLVYAAFSKDAKPGAATD